MKVLNSRRQRELKKLKRTITPILLSHGVLKAGFFGSFVRGKAKKRSDIDILVKLPKGRSLLDLVGLELELEEKLRRKVDVVEYAAIHPMIKDKVLKEEVRIL